MSVSTSGAPNILVVSIEGGAFMDRGMWTTHRVLGTVKSRSEIKDLLPAESDILDPESEQMLILTTVDPDTGLAVGVERLLADDLG